MTGPRYASLARTLPASVPFVGPEEQERMRGAAFDARLGANESVFGPSPKAKAAIESATSEIWKYGDPTSHDLKLGLANHYAIEPENIVVGEGIDGLLGYLVRLLIDPEDRVVTSDGAYPTFNYHVAGYGGALHKVPYKGDHEDLESLIQKANEIDAKLIYFANPDNPMGTWIPGTQIADALEKLPENCLLILDEAYIEFAPQEAIPTLDIDDPRVVRMRTFSKAYGMAGARIGYAMGAPELIKSFDKIRNHFGINRAAQSGALAALQDQAWLSQVRDQVAQAREEITRISEAFCLKCLPSATNFVAIDCGADGAFAQAVMRGLVERGVFVRMPFVAPQNRCIRVSAGFPEDLALFAKALPEALADAKS